MGQGKYSVTFAGFNTEKEAALFADWIGGSAQWDVVSDIGDRTGITSIEVSTNDSIVKGHELIVPLDIYYKLNYKKEDHDI